MASSARKKVSVTFAGDDDVINHIVYADDYKGERRLRKRSAVAKSKSAPKTKSVGEAFNGGNESDEENLATPLFGPIQDDNVFVQGADLFTFKSTKKSDQMIQKAQGARTPVSKKPSESQKGGHTPKSAGKGSSKAVNQKTPVKKKDSSVRRIEATTPFRLRKRNHLEGDESSDGSIDSLSEDDEVESGKGGNSEPEVPPVQQTPRRSTRRPAIDDTHVDMVGDYFEVQSGGAGPTSDRTLAKLGTMSESSLTDILNSVLTSHQRECAQLVEQHSQLFQQWMYQMCNGFNLLVYGLGSKRSLLEEFRERMLRNFTHLVVNGYFPSLTIKQILNSITEDIIGHSANFRNPLDQLDYIKNHYSTEDYEDVYIIINNIDGSMLRAEKVQTVLSLLSQVRGFHIIASLDHINSPLIWDKMKCSRFNWLWYDVTTYIPYTEETSYENSLLVQQTGALALSSLTHVLRSLTLNARRIFLLLAHYQMENKPGNASYIGISFRDMYGRCRENFLVNSDLTLRTQLTEFRDHKLITSKKGHDGMEYLVIPVETATLGEFLESQEEALTQD